MRLSALLSLLFIAGLALLGRSQPAFAQEIAIGTGEEETPPLATPTDVREALLSLLEPPTRDRDAVTTNDPEIALGALAILMEPMTLDDLRSEIAGWYALFRDAIADQSVAEMEFFELIEVEKAAAEAAAADGEASTEDGTSEDNAAPGLSPEHEALVKEIRDLRGAATGLADRLRAVLDAFEVKGGDPQEFIETRIFISEVSGVDVDTSNMRSAMLTIQAWATAEDGGVRLARHSAVIIGATLAGFLVGWVIGLAVSTGLRRTELSSRLLASFVRTWLCRIGALIGALIGLSWIGTNMTPILATLGAAGFILAFALQNTIGNFASGLLILFQRPFDAGDEIEAAGVTGEVEQVSLFSTHLSTAENRKVIVPNNKIWEDVIVNSTGAATRRLQIEIEVNAADHRLEDTEALLMAMMKANPDVLKDPAPDLKLSAMTNESLTFVCWPWVETKNKDRVRWELVSAFSRELTVLKGLAKSGAA